MALGNALIFDGTNEDVTTALSFDLDTINQSISLWAWVDDIASIYSLIGAGTLATPNFWVLIHRADQNGVTLQHNTVAGSQYTTPSADMVAGTWTHIVLVRGAGTNVKIYQNTVKITDENLQNTGFTPASICMAAIDSAAYLKGRLDEINIFSQALSVNDIADLYAGGPGAGYYVDGGNTWPTDGGLISATLVASWHLDESTGASAADSSGNGFTGTLRNMENADWITGTVPLPSPGNPWYYYANQQAIGCL